jgi:translation initiation factor IF-1
VKNRWVCIDRLRKFATKFLACKFCTKILTRNVSILLPDARYRVQLDNGHQLVAYTAGRMKKNRIKTLAGDRVTVVQPF